MWRRGAHHGISDKVGRNIEAIVLLLVVDMNVDHSKISPSCESGKEREIKVGFPKGSARLTSLSGFYFFPADGHRTLANLFACRY